MRAEIELHIKSGLTRTCLDFRSLRTKFSVPTKKILVYVLSFPWQQKTSLFSFFLFPLKKNWFFFIKRKVWFCSSSHIYLWTQVGVKSTVTHVIVFSGVWAKTADNTCIESVENSKEKLRATEAIRKGGSWLNPLPKWKANYKDNMKDSLSFSIKMKSKL